MRRGSAMAARLEAVLRGVDRPKDAAEWIEFAWLCQGRKWFTEAVRLYADAFKTDSRLAADRTLTHRYNAACCALLAAAGQSASKPVLDEHGQSAMRSLACDWLEAELAAWSSAMRHGPPADRACTQPALQHWKQDPDLTSVRAHAALDGLPELERKRWQALWARTDALLHEAAGGRTAP